MPARFALLLAAAVAFAPSMAAAQSGDSISFKVERERTTRNKITIVSLGGASVLFVGVGALFNLDSKSKSDEVSTGGAQLTGEVWTAEREQTREQAIRSRNVAIATYSIGGALALATAIFYIATDPGEELVSVEAGSPVTGAPTFTPVEGGAVVGARWSWR
jgi:hypothetical protein